MKKALGILVAVMALVMALSSCTPKGAPLGLVGQWSTEYSVLGATVKAYIDIRSDDTIWLKTSSATYSKYGDIKKCTCDEITIGDDDSETTSKYELSGDTLKITIQNTERTWNRVSD